MYIYIYIYVNMVCMYVCTYIRMLRMYVCMYEEEVVGHANKRCIWIRMLLFCLFVLLFGQPENLETSSESNRGAISEHVYVVCIYICSLSIQVSTYFFIYPHMKLRCASCSWLPGGREWTFQWGSRNTNTQELHHCPRCRVLRQDPIARN